jgi:hypothetical protein
MPEEPREEHVEPQRFATPRPVRTEPQEGPLQACLTTRMR